MKTSYTSEAILKMCDNSPMWMTQLREAARGIAGITSATPINLVVQALRAKHGAPR